MRKRIESMNNLAERKKERKREEKKKKRKKEHPFFKNELSPPSYFVRRILVPLIGCFRLSSRSEGDQPHKSLDKKSYGHTSDVIYQELSRDDVKCQ
jgi:hypothetical protein